MDCAGLDLGDMGTMGMGGGHGGGFEDARRGTPPELPDGEGIPAMAAGEMDFSPPAEMTDRPLGEAARRPDQFAEVSARNAGSGGMFSLLLSAGVLAVGLIFAAAFRRRR